MSKSRLLTLAVIGLLLVNLGLLTFLFLRKPPPPPPGPEGKRELPKDILIRRLGLDGSQVSKYESLIREHQRNIRDLDRQIRESKNQLYQTLNEPAPVNKDSLILHIAELQKEVETVHYEHFSSIKKILRPEQVKDFEALTAELSGFFAPSRGPGPPPGE